MPHNGSSTSHYLEGRDMMAPALWNHPHTFPYHLPASALALFASIGQSHASPLGQHGTVPTSRLGGGNFPVPQWLSVLICIPVITLLCVCVCVCVSLQLTMSYLMVLAVICFSLPVPWK